MRYQGKITSWKDDQGFGFVIPNGGGEKTFVHIKAFTGRSRRPLEGDFITYEQTIDEKRRFQATNIRNIRLVGEPVVATGRHKKSYHGTIFALLFASFSGCCHISRSTPLQHIGAIHGGEPFNFRCIRVR